MARLIIDVYERNEYGHVRVFPADPAHAMAWFQMTGRKTIRKDDKQDDWKCLSDLLGVSVEPNFVVSALP